MFALRVKSGRVVPAAGRCSICDGDERVSAAAAAPRRALPCQPRHRPHPHSAPIPARSRPLAFFAATGFYGMSLGGHTQDVAQATTTAAGFAIEDVKVSGNDRDLGNRYPAADRPRRHDVAGGARCRCGARKLIAKLPWVEDVEVRKVYPDTIEVKLKERKAFGIWQHGPIFR